MTRISIRSRESSSSSGEPRRHRTARPRGRAVLPVSGRGLLLLILAAAWRLLAAGDAAAWFAAPPEALPPGARGVHVTDGSYVMNVGELQVNITNWGLIGSRYSDLTTYADAPSGQWPAGSGIEYLYAAGLWIGAKVNESPRVSTGQPEAELRPLADIESTIYEARDGRVVRPPGNPGVHGLRPPSSGADDDHDGRRDEEILNGRDDDGDGLIDEDFAQVGDQMMVCTMYDNTRLAGEIYPDHQPLGVRVVQKSYAWESPDYDDFVVLDYTITNVSPVQLEDIYIGYYVDCDIGPRSDTAGGANDLAGFWEGRARGARNYFAPVSVAYMYDGAGENHVPGYLGVLYLGNRSAAFGSVRGYHRFTGLQPYEQGGEPLEDADRYELMGKRSRDPDTEPDEEGDHRFLITAGPMGGLPPGVSFSFSVALVMGGNLDELLENCANAERCWFGEYFDLDGDPYTGVRGRETYTCMEWWPINPMTRKNALFSHSAAYMDSTCVPRNMPYDQIVEDDLFEDAVGNHCIWVNMDNCDECERQMGRTCTRTNRLMELWNCSRYWYPAGERSHCTGILGRESQVNWFVARNAPPSPSIRVVPDDQAVHVFWDDESEYAPDLALEVVDFESYIVWRADDWDRPRGTSIENGPPSDSWQNLAEFDLVDTFFKEIRDGQNGVQTFELPLGANTGLDIVAYRPRCLDDARFAGLAEAMQAIVDADTTGRYTVRPALRRSDGSPVPGLQTLLPWEGWPAVLDTFFMAAERPAGATRRLPGKRAVRFYEYTDRDVHNGFLYFYSVSATDHALEIVDGQERITGPGLTGSPADGYRTVVPTPRAQTTAQRERQGCNIYVYPNPATRQSLAEFQQMHPDSDDPSGVRVVFNNLPRSRNRIRIFTLDGDLVADLRHDGSDGDGQLAWNLISRSGQKIVSGIYLYRVESAESGFAPFTGRFVVIR